MPTDEAEPRFASVVHRIAARLDDAAYATGALAELRRLDPRGPLVQPALHRLLVQHEIPEEWFLGHGLRRWALLIHAIALAAPDLNRGRDGLGRALFAADYKEGRLTRLLEAGPEDLADVAPRMVRFLIAKGEQLDPVALGYFIRAIAAGGRQAENARERIARDYYHAEAKSQQLTQPAA